MNIIQFTTNVQRLLEQPLSFSEEKSYLDLGESQELVKETLAKKELPEANPLAEAVALVINSMMQNNLTQSKLGINELLKAFLNNINSDNQNKCTELFTNYIYEIYLYSLQDSYPYTDLFWGYLTSCFNTVSLVLLNSGFKEGCEGFLLKMSAMGKTSAQKGLHTSSIQHSLHTLELRALELDFKDLAAAAKNHRFNLETF